MKRSLCELDEALRRAGVASVRCLECDVCCRFRSPTASFIPFFRANEIAALGEGAAQHFLAPGRSAGERAFVVSADDGTRCPFFQPGTQECAVYNSRPLDCHLYPFVLMFDEPGKAVWLGADEVCPVAFEGAKNPGWQQTVEEVAELLDGSLADALAEAPGLVSPFQEHVRQLRVLPGLTRRICRNDLGLARLVPTCSATLTEFCRARPTCLTGHAFPAMYLWADLFHLYWTVEADCLLVLAEDGGVSFLMAPPLGRGDVRRALGRAREIMAELNGPRAGGGRVQEVDDGLLPVFEEAGWQVGHEAREYIVPTEAMASLRGRHFDGRRHDIRRFEAEHTAVWRPYEPSDFPQSVALLRRWQEERARRHGDDFYRAQLADSGFLHVRTLRDAEALGIRGWVAEVEGQVVAYTFGFPLADGQTFADFLEVADLEFPGLPAFVFREFCREVAGSHAFVNLGTDSELPNLAQTKQLYRPCRVVSAYVMNPPGTRQ